MRNRYAAARQPGDGNHSSYRPEPLTADSAYVGGRLGELAQNEDLARYVL